MWSYYGAKTNIVDYYPTPKFDKIIEPFAGSARYALKYFDRDVLLVDKYDVIIKIWKWLQLCSPKDILGLPNFKYGDDLDSVDYDCIEARDLLGFLCGFSTVSPRNKVTWKLKQRPNFINFAKKRIASNLFKIKHWEIRIGCYEEITNQEATWFIDPPYQKGGYWYVESGKNINYEELGKWCRFRKGQAIVCENTTADWMAFKLLINQRTSRGTQREGIWSNLPTVFDNEQLKLEI